MHEEENALDDANKTHLAIKVHSARQKPIPVNEVQQLSKYSDVIGQLIIGKVRFDILLLRRPCTKAEMPLRYLRTNSKLVLAFSAMLNLLLVWDREPIVVLR